MNYLTFKVVYKDGRLRTDLSQFKKKEVSLYNKGHFLASGRVVGYTDDYVEDSHGCWLWDTYGLYLDSLYDEDKYFTSFDTVKIKI